MKKFACLRLAAFSPTFAETGRFANVGVVLMAPDAGFFGYRLLLITAASPVFHQLDRGIYLRGRGCSSRNQKGSRQICVVWLWVMATRRP